MRKKNNPRIGPTFVIWLDEAGHGRHRQVGDARQLAAELRKSITKKRMAELIQTTRVQLDRLLYPDSNRANC
jgi:antitoxin HicB